MKTKRNNRCDRRFRRALCATALFCALLFSLPVSAVRAEEDDTLSLSAKYAAVMDVTTGDLLFAKDGDTPCQPASLTKMLSALICIENCPNLNDTVTFSRNAIWGFDRANSIHLYFDTDEQITLRDLLTAVIIRSANEATMAMAEYTIDKVEPKNNYSGPEKIERFVAMMNKRAKELGATNSNFTNPHGLQDDAQYTTARDMALIMAHALKNDTFAQISKTKSYSIPPTNKRGETCNFNNGHDLVRKGTGTNAYTAIGGHQGKETAKSGFNLITYAQNSDGANIVTVVMKASNEEKVYSDTRLLLDHYLINCTRLHIDVSPAFAGKLQIEVFDGEKTLVRTASAEYSPIAHIMPKEATLQKLTHTITRVEGLSLPIEPGTTIGTITWYYKGVRVADTQIYTAAPLTAADIDEPEAIKPDSDLQDVEKSGFFSVLWGIVKWALLILLILIVTAAIVLGAYIGVKRRKIRKARDAAFWKERSGKK